MLMPHEKRQKLRAIYSFAGRTKDELSLCVGDEVVLLSNDAGEGWYFGSCRGSTGVFPASYVEPLDATSES